MGGVEQIETYLNLFESARRNGNYLYYHLLSGCDLPLRPIHDILRFFDSHQGTEFVEMSEDCEKYKFRVQQYHFGVKYIKSRFHLLSLATRIFDKLNVKLQRMVGIRRNANERLAFGSNWVSITERLTDYLLENKQNILQRYAHTKCADEFYLQSLVATSSFKGKVFNGMKGANMRYIVWTGKSSPLTLTMDDYDKMMHSDALFARKFSEKHIDVVERIANTVQNSI